MYQEEPTAKDKKTGALTASNFAQKRGGVETELVSHALRGAKMPVTLPSQEGRNSKSPALLLVEPRINWGKTKNDSRARGNNAEQCYEVLLQCLKGLARAPLLGGGLGLKKDLGSPCAERHAQILKKENRLAPAKQEERTRIPCRAVPEQGGRNGNDGWPKKEKKEEPQRGDKKSYRTRETDLKLSGGGSKGIRADR